MVIAIPCGFIATFVRNKIGTVAAAESQVAYVDESLNEKSVAMPEMLMHK